MQLNINHPSLVAKRIAAVAHLSRNGNYVPYRSPAQAMVENSAFHLTGSAAHGAVRSPSSSRN